MSLGSIYVKQKITTDYKSDDVREVFSMDLRSRQNNEKQYGLLLFFFENSIDN